MLLRFIMATISIRRFCTVRHSVLRNIYTCQSLISVTPVLTNNCDILEKSNTCLPCAYPKSLLTHSFVVRYYSGVTDNKKNEKPPAKPSLLQRFKQMYRDYWYVLLPVHVVTSAAWFGGFYYLAKSGVDIAGLLESWNVSDKITSKLKDSSMGYLAVSYALYKISTPVRYTVTLGGTTISINYLKQWGYIKPVPSTDALKVMYHEKKDNIIESIRERREFYKEKKDNIIESTKIELKMQKSQLKNQKDTLVKDIEESLEKIKGAKADLENKPNDLVSKKGNGT